MINIYIYLSLKHIFLCFLISVNVNPSGNSSGSSYFSIFLKQLQLFIYNISDKIFIECVHQCFKFLHTFFKACSKKQFNLSSAYAIFTWRAQCKICNTLKMLIIRHVRPTAVSRQQSTVRRQPKAVSFHQG